MRVTPESAGLATGPDGTSRKCDRDFAMTCKKAKDDVVALHKLIGIGYHPDTAIADYVDRNGKPSFTKAVAAEWQKKLDSAKDVLDDEIYEIGLRIAKAMIAEAQTTKQG